ncbi:hypothetical protein [Rhodococcus maanshanensis]|uniref:Uncharacterized protein n=1 Tax=Rhodococcus maanshanensis TaxID=183556 RepID=A0A1H7GAE8_9NOCA|nr:hypothetical protein [Rhodococcus maanshanensis]SEK35266.1 hypothetical protein SAMN05444583_101432 [Rhodococcus maanshanensis]
MGIFLKITYDSQGGKTAEKATINQNILDGVLNSLNDYAWQDRIAPQLRNLDSQFSHIALGLILRFYHKINVEKGNLRSLARYIKKDDKLLVDQILVVDEYEDLSERGTRTQLCDDIVNHLEQALMRYKDRFQDFDAVAFIPLLRERFEEIKQQGNR